MTSYTPRGAYSSARDGVVNADAPVGFLQVLSADAKACLLVHQTPNLRAIFSLCLRSGAFRIVVRMRCSQYLSRRGQIARALSWYFYNKNLSKSVDIHPLARIGHGLRLAHPVAIVIGKDASIGVCVRIQQGVTVGGSSGKTRSYLDHKIAMPVIGSYTIIGPGACVLGPIVIGKGCVIGANAVALTDLSEWSVCGGLPAKELRQITSEEFPSIHYGSMVPVEEFCASAD